VESYLPHQENERQRSVNESWSCIVSNLRCERLHIVINKVLASFLGQENVKCSVPHLENERQWSVNDCWPSIMVNHNTMWPLLSIYEVLTVLGR
jgi:hypothetical protein